MEQQDHKDHSVESNETILGKQVEKLFTTLEKIHQEDNYKKFDEKDYSKRREGWNGETTSLNGFEMLYGGSEGVAEKEVEHKGIKYQLIISRDGSYKLLSPTNTKIAPFFHFLAPRKDSFERKIKAGELLFCTFLKKYFIFFTNFI